MATFTLTWSPTVTSADSQIVKWRQKGSTVWNSTTNITDPNPQTYDETTADVGVIPNNWVYQFQVDSVCDTDPVTTTSSTVYEDIVYECVDPDMATTTSTFDISFGPIGNIDMVYAVLYEYGTDVFVSSALLTVAPYNHVFTGLSTMTAYYVKYRLYATVNGISVASSDPAQLGEDCITAPIQTL